MLLQNTDLLDLLVVGRESGSRNFYKHFIRSARWSEVQAFTTVAITTVPNWLGGHNLVLRPHKKLWPLYKAPTPSKGILSLDHALKLNNDDCSQFPYNKKIKQIICTKLLYTYNGNNTLRECDPIFRLTLIIKTVVYSVWTLIILSLKGFLWELCFVVLFNILINDNHLWISGNMIWAIEVGWNIMELMKPWSFDKTKQWRSFFRNLSTFAQHLLARCHSPVFKLHTVTFQI